MIKNIKNNPTKTVLTISVGLIVVYLFTKVKWVLDISLVIGLIGVFSTYLSKKIDFLWMKLAWVLSKIIPNIVLGIVFYLFLFPLSVLSKLFIGKDILNLKNTSTSIFKTSNKNFEKVSFEKPW